VITVYATSWCGDCRLAKRVLEEEKAEYRWVDIDDDAEAARLVQELNGGLRSVPTILFPDGRVLVEPSREELLQALAA
jgi:mycoredoxin